MTTTPLSPFRLFRFFRGFYFISIGTVSSLHLGGLSSSSNAPFLKSWDDFQAR